MDGDLKPTDRHHPMDLSPFAVLQRSCPELLSAMASAPRRAAESAESTDRPQTRRPLSAKKWRREFGGRPVREERAAEEVVASFQLDSPDGRAFFQFLQQWSGLRVSLEGTDPSASSSRGGRLSRRAFQAQLSAALAWASAAHPDDAARPHDPAEVCELLERMDGAARGLDEEDAETGVYEEDTDDEDEEGEERRCYEEDLDGLKDTMERMEGLSLHTMRELAAWWGIQPERDEEEGQYRLNITEQLRLLAATIVTVIDHRLEPHAIMPAGGTPSQSGNGHSPYSHHSNGKRHGGEMVAQTMDAIMTDLVHPEEEQEERVSTLLYSLRHGIYMLDAERLRHFAGIFGLVDRCCSSEDVFMAISSLGVVTFFAPLPTPLLEKVCHELSISHAEDTAMEAVDTNQLPELLAERISQYFYPMRHTIPPASKLPFMPQMQIHEHAPGRYTCTVDNAKLMKVLSLQRLVSNRFSCNKIKWHAVLTVINDEISFCIWHRHTDLLSVHMVIRTQDPKKKRKNNNSNNNNNNNNNNNSNTNKSTSKNNNNNSSSNNSNHHHHHNNNNNNGETNETTLKESSALFLEKDLEAQPGELIGFENFVPLPVALRSSTMSQSGYRLYNPSEDRLVFQYAMDLMHVDGTPLADEARKKQEAANAPKGGGSHADADADATTKRRGEDASNGTHNAEEERRRRDFEKATHKLGRGETQGRESIEQSWVTSHRQLVSEQHKAQQKALQKTKDRERKALLAKVGPSPEQQRELESLTQTLSAHRAQVAKLAKEKAREADAIQRFQEQMEEGNRELERLRQLLKSNSEELTSLEEKANASVARRQRAEERLATRRKQRALSEALRIPELVPTRHETLAIDDLQSFWAPGANGSAAAHSPPSTPRAMAAAPGVGVGPSIPRPRSAALASPPLPPANAGGLTLHGPWAFDAFAMGPGGEDGAGGFKVTAPFTTALPAASGALARFTLDANAQPFTPTAMVAAANGVTSPQSTFTVATGATSLSQRTPPSAASPMTGVQSSAAVAVSGIFPEKPRYTCVSTPVPGGLGSTPTARTTSTPMGGALGAMTLNGGMGGVGNGNISSSGGGHNNNNNNNNNNNSNNNGVPMSGGLAGATNVAGGGGLFSTDPLQAISNFSSPGVSNGITPLSQSNNTNIMLSFTTAPWK